MPIEGVPTSTAAFLGETERGAIRPCLVTSLADYTRWFGGVFATGRFMPHAVRGFFDNGGTRLYACRITSDRATTASKAFGGYTIAAIGPGTWGRRVWVRIEEGTPRNVGEWPAIRVKVAYWGSLPQPFTPFDPFDPANDGRLPRPQLQEDHDQLSIDPSSSDFFVRRFIAGASGAPPSALISITRTSDSASAPSLLAAEGTFLDEQGGDDGDGVSASDFAGAPAGLRADVQGLQALADETYRDVALVYAPHSAVADAADDAADDADDAAVTRCIIDHCQHHRFRFAVIDSARDAEPLTLDPRSANQWDSASAAFYTPWLHISDPQTGTVVAVPPGGHVLGVYARTDSEHGVFKPPANALVEGALGVQFEINERTQGELTPRGVNAIRHFADRGILVWGARTLSSDATWRYISVRRLAIFIERSIVEGTRWAVFEPNDEALWARMTETIQIFLRVLWRQGALLGATDRDAFFVKCDRTTMSEDDIVNGRLVCQIGIAPVRAAEFVILRLVQQAAAADA